ncbi:MAG: MBL fold metallo-hydrolase, partial [Patescibacteria group bacterium]
MNNTPTTNRPSDNNRPRRRQHGRRFNGPRRGGPADASQRTPGGAPGSNPRRTGGRSRRPNNQHRRRPDKAPALTHRLSVTDEKSPVIPEIQDEDTVRIIPVSGVEEIGRNMNIIETKDDIIVIDAGFQFVSEESNAPGINYILPNTQYLEERKSKIRALVITHGHLDHIGGIPFIMERIGNPPLYSRNLTTIMIKKRQEVFPHLPP